MSKPSAWLTPNDNPSSLREWAIFLPDSPEFVSIFTGLLYLLTLPENFEKHGNLSEMEASEKFSETFNLWLDQLRE